MLNAREQAGFVQRASHLVAHACFVYHVSLDCTRFLVVVCGSRVAAILCIASNLEIYVNEFSC